MIDGNLDPQAAAALPHHVNPNGPTILESDTPIDALAMDGERIAGVKCGSEMVRADSFVVALGSYSTKFLSDIVKIPVYPLKGYSITAPIVDAESAPVSTVLDETYKIAITRFDDRIRVGGMAEIVGFDKKLKQARRETLEMCVNDLLAQGAEPLMFLDYFATAKLEVEHEGFMLTTVNEDLPWQHVLIFTRP